MPNIFLKDQKACYDPVYEDYQIGETVILETQDH